MKCSINTSIISAGKEGAIVFQNNRPSGVNPRAIAVDNNTVILQSAVASTSGGHQSIPSTVIVQAPPSSTGTQIIGLTSASMTPSSVSAAVSSPSVISRLTSGDANQVVDAGGIASSHVSVIPSPSFLKRKPEQKLASNESEEKRPKTETEDGKGDASNHTEGNSTVQETCDRDIKSEDAGDVNASS